MSTEQLWCKHYTGVHNKKCLVEHEYETEFGGPTGIIHRLPCLVRNIHICPCEDFDLFTQEESKERERKGKQAFIEYLVARGLDIGTAANLEKASNVEFRQHKVEGE